MNVCLYFITLSLISTITGQTTTEEIHFTTDVITDYSVKNADVADLYDIFLSNVAKSFSVYMDPIISIVGIVGNVLMIAVMSRRKLNTNSVSLYMSALAASDTTVLLCNLLMTWVEKVGGSSLLVLSHGLCIGFNYVFDTFYTYSTWLIVAVAIERSIAVAAPFKAKEMCTKRKAKRVVFGLLLGIALLYLYNIWMRELSAVGLCTSRPKWAYFANYVQPWITGTLYSHVPMVILIVCTAIIGVALARAQRSRTKLGAEKMESMRMTLTTVVIVISFIILTVPLTLFYVVIFAKGQFFDTPPRVEMVRAVIRALGLTNHAVNFFWYVILSAKFRHEFITMVKCDEKSEVAQHPPTAHGNQNVAETFDSIHDPPHEHDPSCFVADQYF